ncbi:MAG TPA: hypothetical protein VJ749_03845 [Pyrinomonadaceae bacterium]|nr:hypothetical protein [Pyrinomonadaceae bacterium]
MNGILKAELERLDGGPTGTFDTFLSEHRPSEAMIDELVLLLTADEAKIHRQVTALLKRLAENGTHFTSEQRRAIFDSLAEIKDWESKLHLCQMLQHVQIPKASQANVAWFLERCLSEPNKFLRAWAYHGFYELAKQHRAYRQLALDHLDRAEREQSAAVKPRIRNIRKLMQDTG